MKALYIILAIALSSCGAQKMEQTYSSTDFTVSEIPYAQQWIGGAPGSGSGVNLFFPGKIAQGHKVIAVYYRNRINKMVSYTASDGLMMVSRFSQDSNKRKDLIMDINATKEMQNEAPSLEKFPFELKDDEAVIALKKGDSDKITYVKITNIEERATLAMPSRPQ